MRYKKRIWENQNAFTYEKTAITIIIHNHHHHKANERRCSRGGLGRGLEDEKDEDLYVFCRMFLACMNYKRNSTAAACYNGPPENWLYALVVNWLLYLHPNKQEKYYLLVKCLLVFEFIYFSKNLNHIYPSFTFYFASCINIKRGKKAIVRQQEMQQCSFDLYSYQCNIHTGGNG